MWSEEKASKLLLVLMILVAILSREARGTTGDFFVDNDAARLLIGASLLGGLAFAKGYYLGNETGKEKGRRVGQAIHVPPPAASSYHGYYSPQRQGRLLPIYPQYYSGHYDSAVKALPYHTYVNNHYHNYIKGQRRLSVIPKRYRRETNSRPQLRGPLLSVFSD